MGDSSALAVRAYWACALVLVVAGLALRADCLQTGFFSDDFVQEAMLRGQYPVARAPLDLFNFVDGSAQEVKTLRDRGALPWWSAPDLKLAMFRPLASALVHVDRALFGGDAWLRHLHSALWWGLGVLAVAWAFALVLPRASALLATALFALDGAHTLPLSWLANRGALVALVLMTTALALHVRARERGRAHAPGALVPLSLGLLAGEWAVPFLGYFVAYEWIGSRDVRAVRLRALVLPLGLGLAYLVARALLGYGTRSSGVYVDALTEPVAFLTAVAARMPVFFADLVLGIPAHHWDFGSPAFADLFPKLGQWRVAHLALGGVALLVVGAALRRLGHARYHPLRWLALGALLALLPMVSSFPTSRLVLPGALGISALLACLVVSCVEAARGTAVRGQIALPVGIGVLALHSLVSVQTLRADAAMTRHLAAGSLEFMRGAMLGDGAAAGELRVVQLAASEHTVALFTPLARATFGRAQPRSFWTLSMADSRLRVHRPDVQTLELTALDRPLLHTGVERLYRHPAAGLRAGQRIELEGLTVEVEHADGEGARRVRFVFDAPLEDPSYRFVTSRPEGIVPVALPAVGGALELPHAGFPGL